MSTNDYESVKHEFDSFVYFLKDTDRYFDREEILDFYIAALLQIWGSNGKRYAPAYQVLLKTLTGTEYTEDAIRIAMACAGQEERKLKIPYFFRKVVHQEAQRNVSNTAQVLERLNVLFAIGAVINGDFTTEEAFTAFKILRQLDLYATEQGVTTGRLFLETALLTTDLAEDSYVEEMSEDSDGEEQSEEVDLKTLFGTLDSDEDDEEDDEPEIEDEGAEDEPDAEEGLLDDSGSLESLLEELDALVGLDDIKQDVHSLINFIAVTKIRKERGMKVPAISYHLVFTGNPGTGKTTVARLVAKIYHKMGILPKGKFVEADRSTLVAGYLGQTAIKTQKVIKKAMGGVLFIDEAYALAGEREDSYGSEAIETLLKAMEDHRDELVVIVAGYTDLMHTFINSNPGLASRFNKYFEYQDYNGRELLEIFQTFCENNGYVLAPDAKKLLKGELEKLYMERDEHFGNARTVRNIFERAIGAQADRITKQASISDADLMCLTPDDVRLALGGEQA